MKRCKVKTEFPEIEHECCQPCLDLTDGEFCCNHLEVMQEKYPDSVKIHEIDLTFEQALGLSLFLAGKFIMKSAKGADK
jgi:hypothetical protein